jgi:hypothetical protein
MRVVLLALCVLGTLALDAAPQGSPEVVGLTDSHDNATFRAIQMSAAKAGASGMYPATFTLVGGGIVGLPRNMLYCARGAEAISAVTATEGDSGDLDACPVVGLLDTPAGGAAKNVTCDADIGDTVNGIYCIITLNLWRAPYWLCTIPASTVGIRVVCDPNESPRSQLDLEQGICKVIILTDPDLERPLDLTDGRLPHVGMRNTNRRINTERIFMISMAIMMAILLSGTYLLTRWQHKQEAKMVMELCKDN